jgi:DNA-binding NarL/FixJ family response regulator
MESTPLVVEAVRVLVVDDFRPWIDTVCSMLSMQSNLRVIGQAADGMEAVAKVRDLRPDLIIMDIGLPSLDGIKATIRVLELAPDAKIIFLTQHRDPEIVRAALGTGAQGYVVKSDAMAELLLAVEGVLSGEKFLSESAKGAFRKT